MTICERKLRPLFAEAGRTRSKLTEVTNSPLVRMLERGALAAFMLWIPGSWFASRTVDASPESGTSLWAMTWGFGVVPALLMGAGAGLAFYFAGKIFKGKAD